MPDLYPIQPEALRAPEVILRAGWNAAADIWNFACLVIFVMDASRLPPCSATF